MDGTIASLARVCRDPLASKRVAIVQSNYIPWKGYFDLIKFSDEFILYDDVQYTRRDWRNRNKIKTKDGVQWLTLPVEVKGKYHQRISDAIVSDPSWNIDHWQRITHSYGKTAHFKEYKDAIEHLYLSATDRYLSEINHRFLTAICNLLGIRTRITRSRDYSLVDGKTERLLHLCEQADATEYLSGPAAKGYLDETAFAGEGIAVRYMEYSDYPEYPQLHPPFEHGVSILDLLFNTGPDAPKYMKGRP